MLFHTTRWGWTRLAAGLLLAPLALAEVSAAPPVRPTMPSVQPQSSDPKVLLREAKAALEAGDFNRAQDLTQQAEASNPTGKWGLFDDSPASLRKKIAAGRQAADKQEVTRLVIEARALLARPAQSEAERLAILEMAMKMARQADFKHGPEYSLWETGDRPDRLIKDIDSALAKVNRSMIPAPPTPASVVAAQESLKPKPPLRLPPPPGANGQAPVAMPATVQKPLPTGSVTASRVLLPEAPIQQPGGVVAAGGVPAEGVEPGGSKFKQASAVMPAAPQSAAIVPPTPPVAFNNAPPEVMKAASDRLILEARVLSTKGEFVAARAKLMEADAMKVEYGPNEGPGFAMQELNALGAEVKTGLVREVQDSIGKKDFARAEAALGGAEQIAIGLKLSAVDVDQARAMLKQAQTPSLPVAQAPPLPAAPSPTRPQPASTASTGSAPGALPMMVIAPPATPELKTPMPPPTRPFAAAPSVDPSQLTGKQLLDQAALELQKGDFAMATTIARQAYNRGDVKPQAQALMNQIDAEAHNARKAEDEKTFDNAVRSFATRDYAATLGALALVDPKRLPEAKRARREELMRECQSALDGTKPPVQTASGEVPAETKGVPKLPAPMAGDPPLMKVDPFVGAASPKTDSGFGKPAEPGVDAKQTHASREVLMQKLHEDGLKAQREAQAAFGAGDTDLAINILNDYSNRVRSSTLDNGRIATLLKPIDSRLSGFRLMRGHVDSTTRLTKENQAAKDILAGRAAAEDQRRAEVDRLMRECTTLIKEKKDYATAERVALQMKQLDPDNPAIEAISHQAKMLARIRDYDQIKEEKEAIFRVGLNDVEHVGPALTTMNPVSVRLDRYQLMGRRGNDDPYQPNRSPATYEIEMKLDRQVSLSFQQTPLKLAVQNVAEKIQVPVWFDESAIAAEGSSSLEQPQNADFATIPVAAKHVLAVLLEGAGLSYVVEHDMLKITTVKKSKGRLFTKVFSVADLVTPVPNFALPDYQNMSKILGKSAIDNPQAIMNGGTVRNAMGMGQMASNPAGVGGVAWDPSKGTNGGKLESVPSGGGSITPGRTDAGLGTQFIGSMTKHEQLIKLVTGMVRPLSWDAAGGNGKIEYYDIGSALVVNQTGDVIREVADLLEALRRLQDLAVAIEMRIVSLSETFFERMGVDFAVNVQTHNTRLEPNFTSNVFRPDPFINSLNGIEGATIGLTPAGTFTPDLNVPIRSTSFNYAIPGFGNYPNIPGGNGGLSLGLAFLNDIQVYMFMEAAQGDRRQNIMQAPKITLFNGQTATISITDFAYFVTNVQVFSVNGQIVFVPQNTPLPIGTQGSLGGQIGVQAVVSADRRFVRVTPTLSLQTISGALTPLFPVTTFITPVFEGGSQGQPIPFTQFLQQPSLATIDVQTTVVCPDGGTVLMGGFKYLAEGRNEFGPPFLSKIPYVNRLFKNVGIGRETRHLMLMITPRIIITAEEELIQTEGVRFPNPTP